MSKTIFAAAIGVKSRTQTEIELRRVEESNQQFREEWIKYSKMKWQSNENLISLQHKTE